MSTKSHNKVGRPPLPAELQPVPLNVRTSKDHRRKFNKLCEEIGSQRKVVEYLIDKECYERDIK